MNILFPVAIEILQFALAYIPNICSENGGICEDGSINLIASEFLHNYTHKILEPLYIITGIISWFLDTIDYNYYALTSDGSIIENTQNYVISLITGQKMLTQEDVNTVVIVHILFCYGLYVFISFRTLLQYQFNKPEEHGIFEGGDGHKFEEIRTIYEEGDEKYCMKCKFPCFYDSDDST